MAARWLRQHSKDKNDKYLNIGQNMKKKNIEIRKEIPRAESIREEDLDKAVERIHQQYGNDLQAFFRDAKESISKQNATRQKNKVCLL